ncbi:hypothetical protein ACWG8W_01210 [Citricoccus zhacaiensis]
MNRRAAITLTAAAVLTGTAAAAVVVPALAADPAGHAPASTTTAQAALSSTNALSPEQADLLDDPQVTVHNDPDTARAAAIAAGRPEAAWDKDCVTWNLPEPEGDDKQAWANELARTWLETHEAGCPDAIVFPHYYVESFTQGAPGELVVTLDDQAARDYATTASEQTGLKNMALENFRALFADHRDLKEVTYTVDGRDLSGTVDQEAWRKITAHWLWADPDFSDELYTEIYGDLPADFSSALAIDYYEDFHGSSR